MPQVPPVAAAGPAPQYPPQPPQQQYPPQPPQGYSPQQYPPGYQGYPQMPPQRPSSPWKWVGIIGGIVALVLVALVVISGMGDDPTDPPKGQVAASAIKKGPIITNKVNEESQAPQGELSSVPQATDLIYASVQIEVKQGDVLGAKWYYGGQQQTHLDTELPVTDGDFSGWASFNISNDGDPWPKGNYKVEIYLNGKKSGEKAFEVK